MFSGASFKSFSCEVAKCQKIRAFFPCEGGAGRLLPAPYLRAGLQHAAPHPSRAAWAGTRPCSFCVCVWMCACIQINCIFILWGGVFFLLRFQSTFGRKAGVWATLIHSGSLLFLVSTIFNYRLSALWPWVRESTPHLPHLFQESPCVYECKCFSEGSMSWPCGITWQGCGITHVYVCCGTRGNKRKRFLM